jgi:hypothetical protein
MRLRAVSFGSFQIVGKYFAQTGAANERKAASTPGRKSIAP